MITLGLSGCWVSSADLAGRLELPRLDDGTPDDTDLPPPVDTDVPTEPTDIDPVEPTDDPKDFSCIDFDLETDVGPDLQRIDLLSHTNDFVGECSVSGSTGRDAFMRWEAPESGCYIMRAWSDDVDTVLSVAEECGSPEVTCRDDYSLNSNIRWSEYQFTMEAGEERLFIVDSFDADITTGDVLVSVWQGEAVEYEEEVFLTDGVLYEGSNFLADTTYSGDDLQGCPHDGEIDTLLKWTVPRAGDWVISVESSVFDAVLSIHRPCEITPWECQDITPTGGIEQITGRFDAGQEVIIRVAQYVSDGLPQYGEFTVSAAQ